jgi:hypothetical protein
MESTKLPLTVDNLVDFLNRQPYTVDQFTNDVNYPNRFKSTDFYNLSWEMMVLFFDQHHRVKVEEGNEAPIMGPPIFVNERYKLKWLENIFLIEFNTMYPNIICKLWKRGDINFNIREFGELFTFVVEHRNEIKNHTNTKDTSWLLCKYFINYTFGATMYNRFHKLAGTGRMITMGGHKNVVDYTKTVFEELAENNKHNIFYIDTDVIYLDFPSQDILTKIRSLEIPYEISMGLNGMFIEKKKYVIQHNNTVKPKGLVCTVRNGYKKDKQRLMKINKLSKILNKSNVHKPNQI